jgi:hypothetical protein
MLLIHMIIIENDNYPTTLKFDLASELKNSFNMYLSNSVLFCSILKLSKNVMSHNPKIVRNTTVTG